MSTFFTTAVLLIIVMNAVLMAWSLHYCVNRVSESISYKRCLFVLIIVGALNVFSSLLINYYVHVTLRILIGSVVPLLLSVIIYMRGFRLSLSKAMSTLFASVGLYVSVSALMLLVLLFSGFFKGLGIGLKPDWTVQGVVTLPVKIKHYVQLTQLQFSAQSICDCLDKLPCVFKKRSRFYGYLDQLYIDHYDVSDKEQLDRIQAIANKCLQAHHQVQQASKAWEQATPVSQESQSQATRSMEPGIEETTVATIKPVKPIEKVIKKKGRPQFVEVSFLELSRYENQQMMIVMNDDTIKQGRLHKAGARSLKLSQFVHGGHSIVTLRFRDIRVVKVLK